MNWADYLRSTIKRKSEAVYYVDSQGRGLDPYAIDWSQAAGRISYLRSDGAQMVKILYHADLYPPKNQIDHVFPDTRPPPFWQVMLLAALLVAWMLAVAQ